MVRPKKQRFVEKEPEVDYFKPRGIPLSDLEDSVLSVEELEAVKLKDLEEKSQKESAEKMNVSQSTFHRIYLSARKKIADALVNGKSIRIEGGLYKMRRSRAGSPQKCVCPNCGEELKHERGIPCSTKKCPECDTRMIGKWK